jgi:hypothetical protein
MCATSKSILVKQIGKPARIQKPTGLKIKRISVSRLRKQRLNRPPGSPLEVLNRVVVDSDFQHGDSLGLPIDRRDLGQERCAKLARFGLELRFKLPHAGGEPVMGRLKRGDFVFVVDAPRRLKRRDAENGALGRSE